MRCAISRIGNIYVEIRGDYSKYKEDIQSLKVTAATDGKKVSDALNNAITPAQASKAINQLNYDLKQLAGAAKVPADSFKITSDAISKDLGKIATSAGLTEKEFSKLTQKMLETQAQKATEKSFRDLASAAGLSQQELTSLGKQLGFSTEQMNKMGAGLGAANAKIIDQQGTLSSLKNSWAMMTTGIAAGLYIFSQIKTVLVDLTKDYVEQEQANIRFGLAMKNAGTYTTEGYRAFKEFAEEMQRATGIQDDYIMQMGALVATTGLSEKAIEEVIKVAADFSKLMGDDMATVINALIKYHGGYVDSLDRYKIATKNARGESLTFSQVLGEVRKMSEGTAQALGETLGGQMEKAKGWWSNLKENIVGAFVNVDHRVQEATKTMEAMGVLVKEQAEVILPKDEAILNKIATATDKVAQKTEKANKALEELNKILEKQAEAYAESWGKMADEYQEMLDSMARHDAEKVKASIKLEREMADIFGQLWGQMLEAETAVLNEMLREEAKKKLESEKLFQDQKEQFIINMGMAYDAEMEQLNEAARVEADVIKKRNKEWEAGYKDRVLMGDDFWAGVKLSYDENLKDQITWGNAGADIWMNLFGKSGILEGTLSGFFTDAFTGNLKTASEYFKAFADSILKMFAEMIAKMIAKWASEEVWKLVTGTGTTGGGGTGVTGALTNSATNSVTNSLLNTALSTGVSTAGTYLGASTLAGAGTQLSSLWSTGALVNLGGDVTATGLGAGAGAGGAAGGGIGAAALGGGYMLAAWYAVFKIAEYFHNKWMGPWTERQGSTPFVESNLKEMLFGPSYNFPGIAEQAIRDAQEGFMPDLGLLTDRFKAQFPNDPIPLSNGTNAQMAPYWGWMRLQPEVGQAEAGFRKWLTDNYTQDYSDLGFSWVPKKSHTGIPVGDTTYAAGGALIDEPMIAYGRSGKRIVMGEAGPEYIVPAGAGGQMIHISLSMDSRVIGEAIYDMSKRGQKVIHQRGITAN